MGGRNRSHEPHQARSVPPSVYRIWVDARRRCHDSNGAITMQEDWQDEPTKFIAYLGGPSPAQARGSIDRIDVFGGYEEGSLRFANSHVQRVNQKRMLGAAHPATRDLLARAIEADFCEEEVESPIVVWRGR